MEKGKYNIYMELGKDMSNNGRSGVGASWVLTSDNDMIPEPKLVLFEREEQALHFK